jgi:hypothetical protein
MTVCGRAIVPRTSTLREAAGAAQYTQGECRAGKVQRVGQGAVDRGGERDQKATLW